VLVVGDRSTLKVHVHTDSPDAAMALFGRYEVSRIDIADMSEQVRDREARLTMPGSVFSPAAPGGGRCGALAVVTGEGFRELFLGLGVTALDGGATLNPSTNELLAAIHSVAAEDVVVLPNSSNVFMAAERAAELSDKNVVVVPSRSLQTGLAAAVALDPDRDAHANAGSMNEILRSVRTGAVARAARDDASGRFSAREAIGFVDDELVAWGDPAATLRDVIARLSEDAELVTCLRGIDAPLDDAAVWALADARVDLELSAGGQESYWWLLTAE
jgi:hypothetical protein